MGASAREPLPNVASREALANLPDESVLDLIFAPDGIETFEDAWARHVEKHGMPIAGIDDIVGNKQAANRQKDRESLPRLLSFGEWLRKK